MLGVEQLRNLIYKFHSIDNIEMADKEWLLDTGSQQDNISKLHTAILKLFNFTAQFRDQERHCDENKAGSDGPG